MTPNVEVRETGVTWPASFLRLMSLSLKQLVYTFKLAYD